jgi:hypothetical protein
MLIVSFCNNQIDVLADLEHHIQQAQEIGAQLKMRKCRAAELDRWIKPLCGYFMLFPTYAI